MGPLNCLDTWKLFNFFFFYRKDKAKLCFLQQDFLLYKKKLEYELNELQCLHSCSFNCERVQFLYQNFKTVYDRAGFFSLSNGQAVLELNKIMKFLTLGEYYI